MQVSPNVPDRTTTTSQVPVAYAEAITCELGVAKVSKPEDYLTIQDVA